MKCIICDLEAEYMYLGNSYCKEHKAKHQSQMQKSLEQQKPMRGEPKIAIQPY